MYKDEAVKILCEQLSMTRLAFAQVVCNFERKYEFASWPEIANSWLFYAAQMPEQEWLAGKDALLHHLRLQSSRSAADAIALLTASDSVYANYERQLKSIYRRKGTKSKELYRLGAERLMEGFVEVPDDSQNINIHGGTRGAYDILVKSIKAWKARIVEAIKWLGN
jgi:hypothetical protein